MTRVASCPSCNSYQSIRLNESQLSCIKCKKKWGILCIHCNIGQLVKKNTQLECTHCSKPQSPSQLTYIIKNRLHVDATNRCQYCNSPTLSKKSSNITSRCFDHPNCANQTHLFDAPKKQDPLVFLDFETTGLDIGQECIIEIGACKVDEDGKEYFFQELVKPTGPIKPIISKITGIDDSMLTHAPKLHYVLDDFLAFCGDANIVAHNAQFDVPWLLVSILRHQFKVNFSKVLCTLKWAKQIEPGKRSLGALSKKYTIGHENAHRALADAVVTKSLYDIYVGSNETVPFEPVDRYLAMSEKIVAQCSDFTQP